MKCPQQGFLCSYRNVMGGCVYLPPGCGTPPAEIRNNPPAPDGSGEPAMPIYGLKCDLSGHLTQVETYNPGFTKLEFACISLRETAPGLPDWLNALIRERCEGGTK